jgi:hypothetical protein
MASVSSSPPSPSPEAQESSALARGFASLVLLAILVVPLGAIALGILWLWNENTSRTSFSAAGAVVAETPAPSAASRERVAVVDQGVDFQAAVRGEVYPLKELSTGKPITEDGEPVYVTAEGQRVMFPVLFRDDFTNSGSGWDGGRAGGYAQGEYRVLTAGPDAEYASHTQQFGDFMLRADARLDRPTTGVELSVGFRFRPSARGGSTAQGGDGYVFVVTPDDRTFRLELWQQESGALGKSVLIPDTSSPAIEVGTAWNRLVVRALGPDLMLLINGQVVGQLRDETSQTGTVTLGVRKKETAPAIGTGDAHFANLVVTSVY